MGPCEVVLSLQFVLLDALEFVAVGVGQPLSEGVDAGGRLLLLRLPQLLPFTPAATATAAAAAAATTTTGPPEVSRRCFAHKKTKGKVILLF